ncbi:MAG: hypothetical protein IKK46_00995 [Clostridia bacterium]|jgi:DNA-directed RNA polymerase subunit RPC12/RpoP|nr:hypothetical protein [Oscillospiraceae bacterium]MBR3789121.1 hypothetical protein [Clostridia bacterium]MBR3808863.1 hypothetical protein [Clostridia bacterium]
MTLTEKVAYLKGLAEGLNLDKDAKETKLFEAMFDILEDMALTVNDIDEDLAAVEELVDCIDEDLDELEDIIYDDDCDCDCGCGCDDDFDCDCGDELYEVECPSCGEAIYLDESMFDEEYIECPECGEKLELDIDFEDCDCDCDCCDDED